ncbi:MULTISPECIES: hypothetical protein [unclassified Sphingopyxis]|jgi:hypothetical protein|uniref:hypothetical protein n=1 Tax=unclassified Sphingopyxis TaxID=2614943 RepID=UPI0006C532D9|nr:MULTISPECIES: hypothetical protein [unclassified Sphingopyxis]USI76289.1 hypothetical protein KEC45_16185 [Sphingopyxis sp. USTB-05]GAO76996.1 hypothetical protein SC1_00285 [Sphingopyxis sp. C-1]
MKYFATAAVLAGGLALATMSGATAAPAAAPATATADGIARPDVPAMSRAEIRAFNAKLPPNHPYYITCRQSSVTGSLAKVTRVCLTREDRERIARDAQDETHTTIDRSRASAGCDPYC